MKDYTVKTFKDYLRSIFVVKKVGLSISIGSALSAGSLILGVVVDSLTLRRFLSEASPFYAFDFIPLISLIGPTLLIWGTYKYSNYLYKQLEVYKVKVPQELAFSKQAESFFKQFRTLLREAISTKKLENTCPTIKFVGFNLNMNGDAQAVLHIENLESCHSGAQIKCVTRTEINVSGSVFHPEKYLGLLEIEHVDESENLAYCLMKDSDDNKWREIISGVKKDLGTVKFPEGTTYNASVYPSLESSSLEDTQNLFNLLVMFNKF